MKMDDFQDKNEWAEYKRDEIRLRYCIKNDEFCFKNDEFCIKNDEFCIKNDEL